MPELFNLEQNHLGSRFGSKFWQLQSLNNHNSIFHLPNFYYHITVLHMLAVMTQPLNRVLWPRGSEGLRDTKTLFFFKDFSIGLVPLTCEAIVPYFSGCVITACMCDTVIFLIPATSHNRYAFITIYI